MSQWGVNDNAANSPYWVGAQFGNTLSQNTQNTMFGNVTPGIFVTGANVGVFGVANGEMVAIRNTGVSRPAHAGWNLRTEGSGGRAGRVFYETLVATKTFIGDAEDAVFADYVIYIVAQPSSSNEATGNAISFTVVANTVPSGATITYSWQVDGGPSSQTWVDVANTGVYASANGNTSATLDIANNITLSGNNYRVVLSTSGADTVYSSNAQLLSY